MTNKTKHIIALGAFHSLMAIGYIITVVALSPFLALWWIDKHAKTEA
jgi:hypothetical protein